MGNGEKGKASKTEHGRNDERPTSPSVYVSLPPEGIGIVVDESNDSEIQMQIGPGIVGSTCDNQIEDDISIITEAVCELTIQKDEEFTSLGTNLKDIIPKLLNIDHNNKTLKIRITHLEELLAKTQSENERLQREILQNKSRESLPTSETAEIKNEKALSKSNLKMKRQLKKALDANEAWNIYSKDQHQAHLKQIKIKNDVIHDLERKCMDSSEENQLNRLEDENTMLHDRYQHMEEEHRKIMKLAKGLHKTKGDLQIQIQNLKKEIDIYKTDYSPKDKERDNVKAAENNSTTHTELKLVEVNERNVGNPFRTVESQGAHIPRVKKNYDTSTVKSTNLVEKPTAVIHKQKPRDSSEMKPPDSPEMKPPDRPEMKPRGSPEMKLPDRPEMKPRDSPEMKPRDRPEMKPRDRPEMKPRDRYEMKPRDRPAMKPRDSPAMKPHDSSEMKHCDSPEMDNIFFLQAQIKQYQDDFIRERQDRERAFGEMHDIKRELENAKLMLHNKEQFAEKKKGKFVNPLKFSTKLKKDNRKKESSDGGLRVIALEDAMEHLEDYVREERYQEEDGANGNHVYHEILK